VKINFLAGRVFMDDADLQAQCFEWQARANTARPSQATDVPPVSRLVEEVAKGYPLPSTAADYGFAEPGGVSSGALVAVLGNSYSVPIEHVGAPITARVHRERIVIVRRMEPTIALSTRLISRRCSGASREARSCCTARHSWVWEAWPSST
jgi:hypothetical protein